MAPQGARGCVSQPCLRPPRVGALVRPAVSTSGSGRRRQLSSIRRLGSPAGTAFPLPAPHMAIVRPVRIGDPFTGSCTVPKPLELVSALDGGLPRPARPLLNVLLAAVWPNLGQWPVAVFEAVAADLRRAAGWRASDNRQLFAVARALTMTSVGLPLLRTSPDAPIPQFPFLSIAGPSRDRHCLQFAFASPLAPCLVGPARWAPVDLAVVRGLPSGAAVVLYEHLIQQAGQRRPVWRVRVDELRAFLGAASERSWRDLRRHIVAPAITRIQSAAGLQIMIRAAPDRFSGHVEQVVFVIGRARHHVLRKR